MLSLALAGCGSSGGDAEPPGRQPAVLVSPAPGTTLPGDTVTFAWTDAGPAARYALDIGSRPGGDELYSAELDRALQVTVGGLPTDGRRLHVRLWTRYEDRSLYSDHVYTAHRAPEPSPTAGLERIRVQGSRFVDASGRRFRCWGVNVAAFFPDEAMAAGFARHLAERGINCVRWHHMMRPSPDWIVKSDILALATYEGLEFLAPDDPRARRCPDSDQVDTFSPHFTSRVPDPEAWRRFDRLNAELEKYGIYILLGTHWLRDYGTGDVDVPPFGPDAPDREAWQRAIADLHHRASCWGYGSVIDLFKMLPVIDERARALEKEFLTTLLTRVNPDTGRAYKDSAQVLALEITNEFSSIYAIVNGNRYYDERYTAGFPGLRYFQDKLEARWAAFLEERGVAYFDLYLEDDSPLPVERRDALRIAFLDGLDRAYHADMKRHLEALGAGDLHVTYSTLWRSEPDTRRAARDPAITHTEDHIYANPAVVEPLLDHPDEDYAYFRDPPHPYEDFVYALSVQSRLADKPFLLGEINIAAGADESFAGLLARRRNQRSMQLLAAAAYGAFHDWAGVFWFAWNHGDRAVAADGRGEHERIPRDVWGSARDREALTGNLIEDAMTLDHLRTAGRIFRQGLVAPSREPITLYVHDRPGDPVHDHVYGYPVVPQILPVPGWQNVHAIGKVYGPPPAGHDPDRQPHMTTEPPHPLVADTGEIVKDVVRGQLTVDAPRAEAFSGYLDDRPPAALDTLLLSGGPGFATVILVSADDLPLEDSRHLILSRSFVPGVTGPQDVEAGEAGDGPQITLTGLRAPGTGEHWTIRFTRGDRAAGAGPIPLQWRQGRLVLPGGGWGEAELELIPEPVRRHAPG